MTPGGSAVRLLGAEDWEAAHRLGQLAFGGDPAAPMDPDRYADVDLLGCFDRGRLAAKANLRPYREWFGGRPVPMGGVAGVAVRPEHRARGLAQQVLTAGLTRMRERGQVVSALFATAVGLYRRLGWELAGSLSWTRLATAALLRASPGGGVEVRSGTAEDLPAVHGLYTAMAAAGNGRLDRTGPMFRRGPAALLELDGFLVAERAGSVVGYTGYSRGRGYGTAARLEVNEVVANGPDAVAALLRVLGSWVSVTPQVQIRVCPDDAVALVLPDALPPPGHSEPWMLRVVDAPAAVAARGFPAGLAVAVDLDIADPQLPANSGRFRLEVADGAGRLEPGGDGAVRLHIRALSALYGAAAGTALLRRAGLLDGEPAAGHRLDLAFAGPPPQLTDYF